MPRWNNNDRTALGVIRANAGYSREKAAAIMDMSISSLIRYEDGTNDIPIGIVEEMAVIYHVPFDDLREAIKKTKEAAGMRTVGRHRKTLTTRPRVVLTDAEETQEK